MLLVAHSVPGSPKKAAILTALALIAACSACSSNTKHAVAPVASSSNVSAPTAGVVSATASAAPPTGEASSPSATAATSAAPPMAAPPTTCVSSNIKTRDSGVDNETARENYGNIIFTNMGPGDCLMSGYPTVYAVGDDGQTIPSPATQSTVGGAPATITLSGGGGQASFGFGRPKGGTGSGCFHVSNFQVTAPSAQQYELSGSAFTTCSSGGRVALDIGPVRSGLNANIA